MQLKVERPMLLESDKGIEDLLASDHASLDHAFDALLQAIDENNAVASFTHLDQLWARLGVHIRAEHLCLFPAILNAMADESAKPPGTPEPIRVRFAIEGLRHDHDFFMHAMARAINILRNVQVSDNSHSDSWQGVVREIILAIRHRLEAHNAVEEEKVYRWARLVLTGSDQARLASRVRKELENLPPRFKEN